jgi:hypothetical protein
MNNDGWQTAGTGQSDNRLAGKDLQHNRQARTADEFHEPIRQVRQQAQMGGPMKEHMDGKMPHQLSEHLSHEMKQHEHAKEHAHHHMEKHHSRHHDSQHGHDHHKHHYGE